MRMDPEGHELTALTELAPELEGARVLEVGCGDGRLTLGYAGSVRSIVAVDPDQTALATFRQTLPEALRERIELRAAPFNALEVTPGSFDVVLFSWSL
jgi:ubiquinone/menaquinone biosynthesis C-methylase UbiE